MTSASTVSYTHLDVYKRQSKQYVENGIHMKVLSKGKPNENCVLDNDITLEDAYIYLTNS